MKTISEVRKESKSPVSEEMESFLDYADKLLDLVTLVRWAKLSLLSAEIPCNCDDGGCLRYQTELIAEKHRGQSANERMADLVKEPVKGQVIPF